MSHSVKYKKIRVFVLLSLLIGIFLSLVQVLGYFTAIDAAVLQIRGDIPTREALHLDGILAILFFAIAPGVGVFIWTEQKGLLLSLVGLALYWLGCWWYWEFAGRFLPILAPGIAAAISVIRALGWKRVLDSSPGEHERVEQDKSRLYRFMAAKLFGEAPAAATVKPANQLGPTEVFLSYRREGGAETARLVREELERHGVHCFLDVEDLGASHFDERLLREIEIRPNFVVILSAGCLDRCTEKSDWLRREISFAIAQQKNVVPILKEGFEFPPRDALPDDLADLPRYNCVVYSHAYFSATVERLLGFLEPSHTS
jgi:hypothetical protein